MIHVMNFDGKIIDFFSRQDQSIIEAKHMRNIDEDIETFDFTINSEYAENLRQRYRIIAETEKNVFREFIIDHITDDIDGYTEVSCIASWLEDIESAKPIPPDKLTRLTLIEAMNYALTGTGWDLGDVAWQGQDTYLIENYMQPLELLKELKKEYGHEYDAQVTLGANEVLERKIHCPEPNSLFNGREIVYGKDLVEMKRTLDYSELVTAYLVVGPEYKEGANLTVEVVDDTAQARFGIPEKYNWAVLEIPDETARVGATTTTTTTKATTTTTVKKVTTTTTKKRTTTTTTVKGTVLYTVKAGDSLSTIAAKYGTTYQNLMVWNKLKSTLIVPKQKLYVTNPAVAKTTTTTTTKKKVPVTTTTTTMPTVIQTKIKENMKKFGEREIAKVNKTALSYEVTSIDISKQFPHEVVNIGDKVRIKNRDFTPPLYADARVIEITTDIISREQEYKFGEIKEYKEQTLRAYFNKLRAEFTRKLNDNIDNVNTIVEQTIFQLDVFERKIEKGDEPPENPQEGDLWYDTSNGDVAVLREYINGEWVNASADDVAQVGGLGREAIAFRELVQLYAIILAEQTKQTDRYNKLMANQYLVDEELKSEMTIAYNLMIDLFTESTTYVNTFTEETASMSLVELLSDTLTAYRASVTDLFTILNAAQISADAYLRQLQMQYTDEKYNKALSEVAKKLSLEVKDGVLIGSPNVNVDISSAVEQKTQEMLANYMTKAQYQTDKAGIVTRLDSADSARTQLANSINDKVTITEYNNNKTAVNGKIDGVQSNLNATNTRLSTAESNIEQNGRSINLTVKKADYDKDAKTLSQAISAINVLADGITLTNDSNGKISSVSVGSKGISLNSSSININDGDVSIQKGVTTIRSAVITNAHIHDVKMDKIQGGELILGGWNYPYKRKANGEIEYESIQDDEGNIITSAVLDRTKSPIQFPPGNIDFRDENNVSLFQIGAEGRGADKFTVGQLTVVDPIINDYLPTRDTGSMTYRVWGSNAIPDDTETVKNFEMIQDAVDAIPDIISSNHTINVMNDYSGYGDPMENVTVRSKTGAGAILIDFKDIPAGQGTATSFSVEGCSCRVYIKNAELFKMSASREYQIRNYYSSYVGVQTVSMYGDGGTATYGVLGYGGGFTEVVGGSIYYYQDCVSGNYLNQMYVSNTVGDAARYGAIAWRGAYIHLYGIVPTGKNGSSLQTYGGMINDRNASYPTSTTTTTRTTSNTTTRKVQQKTSKFKPSSANHYRYSGYNSWARSGDFHYGYPVQGTGYGAPLQVGCWFGWTNTSTGANMATELKGKTIKSIKITVTRRSGIGNASNAKFTIRMHKHNTQPSVAPTFSAKGKEVLLDWNQKATVDVTSSLKEYINTGNFWGFGIKASTSNQSEYGELSTVTEVTVVYET